MRFAIEFLGFGMNLEFSRAEETAEVEVPEHPVGFGLPEGKED